MVFIVCNEKIPNCQITWMISLFVKVIFAKGELLHSASVNFLQKVKLFQPLWTLKFHWKWITVHLTCYTTQEEICWSQIIQLLIPVTQHSFSWCGRTGRRQRCIRERSCLMGSVFEFSAHVPDWLLRMLLSLLPLPLLLLLQCSETSEATDP